MSAVIHLIMFQKKMNQNDGSRNVQAGFRPSESRAGNTEYRGGGGFQGEKRGSQEDRRGSQEDKRWSREGNRASSGDFRGPGPPKEESRGSGYRGRRKR